MSLKIIRRSVPSCGSGYGPPGDGPFPAILLLHGSEGKWSGWIYRTAVILAAHGFLAIPFGYSNGGNGWNAGDIIDVPLDRTAEALAALRAHELSGNKIGLYGTSRGAEHALLLASLMARDGIAGLPDAVAVHSPPTLSAAHSTPRSCVIFRRSWMATLGSRKTGMDMARVVGRASSDNGNRNRTVRRSAFPQSRHERRDLVRRHDPTLRGSLEAPWPQPRCSSLRRRRPPA